MFPKTKLGKKKHKKHKRELEISLVVEMISKFFKDGPEGKNINILEFGSGEGLQIPYLQQMGNVVALDIYVSNNIKDMKDVNFIKCSITNTPFGEGQFDIIFSSHVIEHVYTTTVTFIYESTRIKLGGPTVEKIQSAISYFPSIKFSLKNTEVRIPGYHPILKAEFSAIITISPLNAIQIKYACVIPIFIIQ